MGVAGIAAMHGCGTSPSATSSAAGARQSATGGSVGSGGSNGNPSAASGGTCSNVSPCGGELVGAWTVRASCLTVGGELDLSLVGTGATCQSTPISGSLQVSGSIVLNGDGTYTDQTTTSGTERFSLAPACLSISSTPVSCSGAANLLSVLGYASLTCSDTSGGGCDCTGTVHQAAGLGLLSVSPSSNGMYTRAGNVLSLSAYPSDAQYPYCASATELTLSVQSSKPSTMGTITLQRGGASAGAGGSGAGESGGAPSASGGTSSSGSGGAVGSAGASGMIGSAGSAAAGATMQPCDIYQAGGTPCVAAHSTVRALFAAYTGKLYQVQNAAGATKDITTLMPGGIADGLSQDAFCAGTTCVITVVYDQSGKGNDLWYQGSAKVPASPKSSAAKATSEALTVAGH
ncbi:MAG TPA: arabinofuranosidase catalytic domain-containing protein, partial [Polyangiaceae bacterium]|nr:arabinofuranosidase catalytic domain-containing protein [Polyangiaceae bacterium]